MRKGKFLLFLCIFCVCFVFFTISTSAQEATEQVVVTYQDQFDNFWNTWFGPLASIGFGGLTAGGVILFFFKLISKKVKKSEDQNKDAYTSATNGMNEAKENYEDSNQKLLAVVENIKDKAEDFTKQYQILIDKYKEQFEIQTGEIDLLLTHISVLKDLMCKLVASNPELASNGYATEIMKICDETNLFEIKNQIMETIKKVKEGEQNE